MLLNILALTSATQCFCQHLAKSLEDKCSFGAMVHSPPSFRLICLHMLQSWHQPWHQSSFSFPFSPLPFNLHISHSLQHWKRMELHRGLGPSPQFKRLCALSPSAPAAASCTTSALLPQCLKNVATCFHLCAYRMKGEAHSFFMHSLFMWNYSFQTFYSK